MSSRWANARVGVSFLLGVAFGAGLVLGMGVERSRADAGNREVVQVRGIAGASGHSAPRAMAFPNPASAAASASPPALDPASPVETSARGVARDASTVTAYLESGNIYGAGVVIGEHHVLTCWHVVEGMKDIEVSIANGPMQPAELVDRDVELDLAVLRVASRASAMPRLGSVTEVEPGDLVYAMGAPRKMSSSLSRGIASYTGRRYGDVYYLQTDLPTNGGSSGGPVLDAGGRVVALSSFILRDSQGLSFALPIDYAVRRFRERFDVELDTRPFDEWLEAQRPAGQTRR